jgi:hypothetical protein
MPRISRRLRREVFERANGCCEYCRSQALYTTESFEVEHITPTSRGGTTAPENLALACSGCNGHKYEKTEVMDEETASLVPLFHPRLDRWDDHFAWNDDFTQIVGISAVGRATVTALQMNAVNLQNWRRVMRLAGLHPPIEK